MKVPQPRGIPEPVGGYSHGLVVDSPKLFFISGQTPECTDGLPEGFDAQCEQVWVNVTAVLDSAGLVPRDLVKVTTFLADRAFAEANGRIRRRVLGNHRPALTVVIAGLFDPAWLLEIEAIAAFPTFRAGGGPRTEGGDQRADHRGRS